MPNDKRLPPVKFNVVNLCLKFSFGSNVFCFRSASVQIGSGLFQMGSVSCSGEEKNSKSPKCRKKDIGAGDGGFAKEGFFGEEKTSIGCKRLSFATKKGFQKAILT